MPDPIHVTRLRPADLQAAQENISLFWEQVPTDQQMLEFLHKPSNFLFAAWVGEQPAGQVTGYLLPRWDANPPMLFLYSIDVLPRYRRRGIGRLLVEAFRRAGREAGCGKTFVLTSENNLAAVRLYTTTGAHRPHDDDVLYVWEEGLG